MLINGFPWEKQEWGPDSWFYVICFLAVSYKPVHSSACFLPHTPLDFMLFHSLPWVGHAAAEFIDGMRQKEEVKICVFQNWDRWKFGVFLVYLRMATSKTLSKTGLGGLSLVLIISCTKVTSPHATFPGEELGKIHKWPRLDSAGLSEKHDIWPRFCKKEETRKLSF